MNYNLLLKISLKESQFQNAVYRKVNENIDKRKEKNKLFCVKLALSTKLKSV